MIYSKEMWEELFAELSENAEVIRYAEIAAEKPLYTVTKKNHELPVGGTPNDYVSIGPYWWPDPEKEDGLPWIRRDGEINPVFYEYDSETLFNFTTDTGALILGGMACKRQDWLDRAAMQLENWFLNPETRMNTNIKFGQFVPGRATGRCFGIIDVKELYWLFELAELMPHTSLWTPEKLNGVRQWADEMLHWLLNDELGIQEGNTTNNHAISYDCMVAAFAIFAGKKDIAAKQLQERSIPRIAEQFAEDGSLPLELDRTDSKGYSAFTITCFIQAAVMGRKLGVIFPDEMFRKGFDWILANINSPDWKWQQIVPFNGIPATLYQFAGMLWNREDLLNMARTVRKKPWNNMIYWRKLR